ncbi:MAG: DUF3035 domain-containing protein [Parvularculaceae bacterium]
MTKFTTLLGLVLCYGFLASGCAGMSKALGTGKNPPDEFAIVTKSPLVLPPDYALKPPKPGETRPDQKSPSERAKELLLGDVTATAPSDGELMLLQSAGALEADRNIRAVLAAENGGRAEKPANLANAVLFWRTPNGKLDISDAPLRLDGQDPEEWLAARQKVIDAVTGGKQVIIAKSGRGLRLPGVK